jgi:hypothetical protein
MRPACKAILLIVLLSATLAGLSIPANSQGDTQQDNPALGSSDPPMAPPEFQQRINHIGEIIGTLDESIRAFYRQNRRMPSSLQELYESGWVLFMPVSTDDWPNLEITEEVLGPWQDNLNKIRISFTETGYVSDYYLMNFRCEGELWSLMNWDKQDAIARYEQHLSLFSDSRWTDRNERNIRVSMMDALSVIFFSRYFIDHGTVPTTVDELLNSAWEVNSDAAARLPIINENESGWFYLGVIPESGLMYVEYCLADSLPTYDLKVFKENDPLQTDPRVIGRSVICDPNAPTRDETIPLIDSSKPGWGLL